jgi:hypothetical protein
MPCPLIQERMRLIGLRSGGLSAPARAISFAESEIVRRSAAVGRCLPVAFRLRRAAGVDCRREAYDARAHSRLTGVARSVERRPRLGEYGRLSRCV